ncbi:alpha/beta fold hydrolase [Corynebacterium uterequi]|uniref:Putative hydrolase or acyltransferase of alpha/beta superfamily n=1 Tax=Corynebacterium uterequi TaxID=1072256 RepID=A0A0G3HDV3_9CORY|nr:alpha/beta hydrolase [Corynebacterium uterequi]AKK11551.1 putative hydrolase or acyltransferase of alpha/beta superfamily [Corynebacterium uterequi]
MKLRTTPWDAVGALRRTAKRARILTRGRERAVAKRPKVLTDAIRGEIVSNGSSVATYLYEPIGEPEDVTVVFVHGYTLSAESFFQQVDFLREQWPGVRILLLDLRGHGNSAEVPAAECTIEGAAADVRAAIDILAPDGRIVLVGHSLGGPVSLCVLRRADAALAERISGFVSVSGSLVEMSRRGLARLLDTDAMSGVLKLYRAWPESVFHVRQRFSGLVGPVLSVGFFIRHTPVEHIELHAGLIAKTPTASLAGFAADLRHHSEFEARTRLVGLPGYVIVGENDYVTPVEQSLLLHRHWPGSYYQAAPKAGHMLPLEVPGFVNTAIHRLLEHVTGRGA